MWGAQASMRAPVPLISFKAGKLRAIPIENRFRVEADDRRGLLLLEKGQDMATHLIWKDRQTLQVVDDVLVFPGDQTLEKVDTGRPEDRVYLLSFKTSAARRIFFWMQDPDGSKDEDRVRDFNKLMNEPAASAPPIGGIRGASNIASTASAAASASAAPIVGLDELSNILSGLGYEGSETIPPAPAAGETPASTTEGQDSAASMDVEGEEQPPGSGENKKDEVPMISDEDLLRALEGPTMTPNLARILTGDALDALIRDADEDVIRTLVALLPEGHQTVEELRVTFRSPQLRQTLVQLSKALNSENINMVLINFGLDPTAGAHLLQIGDGIGAFLAAIDAETEIEEAAGNKKQ